MGDLCVCVCAYRLDYRVKEWDIDFRAYLKDLDSKKPVVLCGDLNVAHNEIGNGKLNVLEIPVMNFAILFHLL